MLAAQAVDGDLTVQVTDDDGPGFRQKHAPGGRATAGNLPGGGAMVALEFPGAIDHTSRGQDDGREWNPAPACARLARLAR